MSKSRAIILSVTIEGLTQSEAASRYDVSKGWVSKLMARYRSEGDTAFEPRSRRPRNSPTGLPDTTVELIANLRHQLSSEGHDAGTETIAWHLRTHHQLTVSVSTIRRRLLDAGLITAEPKKRPRSSYIRFEADLPNETWQSDFTHWRLADSTDTEILVWLDDHSRYALSVTAHQPVTGSIVLDTFTETAPNTRAPSLSADRQRPRLHRPVRRLPRRTQPARDHPRQPRHHPETLTPEPPDHLWEGRAVQLQTMKNWLTAQTPQPNTIEQLQALIDVFVDEYNHHRPHRSLGRTTPAVAYQRLPKTGPAGSSIGPHYRVRRDRIDKTGAVSLRRAGRMHHISIGRAHKHIAVILLIDDLHIRVINTDTGELLRALTLDPTVGYQPRFKKR